MFVTLLCVCGLILVLSLIPAFGQGYNLGDPPSPPPPPPPPPQAIDVLVVLFGKCSCCYHHCCFFEVIVFCLFCGTGCCCQCFLLFWVCILLQCCCFRNLFVFVVVDFAVVLVNRWDMVGGNMDVQVTYSGSCIDMILIFGQVLD